jgi:RNA polymerase sigma-70 factor (ECF subfamily)
LDSGLSNVPADEQDNRLPLDKAGWFTTTHWSVVLMAGHASSPGADAAMERLCKTYWHPLYGYVRRRGYGPEDAQDLTQAFFARLLEKNSFAGVGMEKGKFRSFLLSALNHFLANEADRARAQKRGEGKAPISLDAAAAEGMYSLEPVCDLTPEKIFEQRWAATLLDQAFGRLRQEYSAAGKQNLFAELSPFLTDGTGFGEYGPVAERLKMAPGTVAVAMHRLKQRYRECVREEVANTVTGPAELEEEMRHLFAVLAG